jgi:hypothetical protein
MSRSRLQGPRYGSGCAALFAVAMACVAFQRTGAQESYSKGQNIVPVFEGWELNPDESFNLVFGYLNRNWDEEVDLPIGPTNTIEPGGSDQGQPTHFFPRRNRFVFRIRVPKDFGNKEVVWTLTSRGKTVRAYATLKPDYFMDANVITTNSGAAGAGTNLEFQNLNKAPKLKLEGSPSRTVTAGQAVSLTAFASDDGIPKRSNLPPVDPVNPSGGGVSTATGLRLVWFVYRGAGKVTFDPPQFKAYEDSRGGSPWAPGWIAPPVPPDGQWVVHATFSEPGTYVLRCQAHDGALMTNRDVTVTVTR